MGSQSGVIICWSMCKIGHHTAEALFWEELMDSLSCEEKIQQKNENYSN